MNYRFPVFFIASMAAPLWGSPAKEFEIGERVQIPIAAIAQHYGLVVNQANQNNRYLAVIAGMKADGSYLVQPNAGNKLVLLPCQIFKNSFAVHIYQDGSGLSLITESFGKINE